jgi:DNA-binding IclR family transcriptional regulator
MYRIVVKSKNDTVIKGSFVEGREIANNQGIQVISRAASILRLLGRETNGLSLGQIAERVNLPRSTVQRIVSALADEGFIASQKGNGTIRLGPQIQQLAQASGRTMKDRMRPVMKGLSDETGETVDLALFEDGRMRFVDQIEGSQRLRTVSRIGDAFPLTTTANGKAALACLDRSFAMRLIKSELGISGNSSKTLKRLLSELDDISDGGLARDENEHTDGISAIGIAIKNENGDIYALSIPVPSARYEREKTRLSRAIKKHIAQLN